MFYFNEPIDDPIMRMYGHQFTEPDWMESAGARFMESWIRAPLSSLYRYGELTEAQIGESEKLDQTEYKSSSYYRDDIEWYEGMNEASAEIIAERKDDENKRQDIISRTPTGLITSGSLLAVDFAGQLLDPLNVAAMFVPVVSQARTITWAARYGKTAARAMTGAIEGVVGTAMIEPIVLGASKQEQADYDDFDSLMAMSFGVIFGAGLHTGFGKVGDFLGISQLGKDAATKSAIGQVLDDMEVDVEDIIIADKTSWVNKDIINKPLESKAVDDILDLEVKTALKNKITWKSDDIKVDMDEITNSAGLGKITEADYDEIRLGMNKVDKTIDNNKNAIDAAKVCLVG